jgi:hypothetical protein
MPDWVIGAICVQPLPAVEPGQVNTTILPICWLDSM